MSIGDKIHQIVMCHDNSDDTHCICNYYYARNIVAAGRYYPVCWSSNALPVLCFFFFLQLEVFAFGYAMAHTEKWIKMPLLDANDQIHKPTSKHFNVNMSQRLYIFRHFCTYIHNTRDFVKHINTRRFILHNIPFYYTHISSTVCILSEMIQIMVSPKIGFYVYIAAK